MPYTLPQCAHLPPRTPRCFGRRARHETGHPLKPRCRFQWGQRLSALETGHPYARYRAGARASMGPTPFSVGYKTTPKPPSTSARCFNGANAFQRWILGLILAVMAFPVTLQWGQRLSALDTMSNRPGYKRAVSASMGPTPFSVGYSNSHTEGQQWLSGFNGANAFQRWIPRCRGR